MKQELPNEHYKKKLISITNVLKNSKLGLAKITPAGSRAKQEHRPDSDQDVILAVSGNPSRKKFYPKLEIWSNMISSFPRIDPYNPSSSDTTELIAVFNP